MAASVIVRNGEANEHNSRWGSSWRLKTPLRWRKEVLSFPEIINLLTDFDNPAPASHNATSNNDSDHDIAPSSPSEADEDTTVDLSKTIEFVASSAKNDIVITNFENLPDVYEVSKELNTKKSDYTKKVTYWKYPNEKYSCDLCGDILGTFKELRKHVSNKHKGFYLKTYCSKCDKEAEYHNIACHYAKCKGRPQKGVLQFLCSFCDLRFGSKIGVSQHARHAHPRAQNEARLAALASIKPSKLWSQEEILLLAELEKVYENKRNINALMVPHFDNKNSKQIAEKRRDRRDKRKKTAKDVLQASIISENDSCDEPEVPVAVTTERRRDFINRKRAPKIKNFDELNDRITEVEKYTKNIQHHDAAMDLMDEIVTYISENTNDISPVPANRTEPTSELHNEPMNSAQDEQPIAPVQSKIAKKDKKNVRLNRTHKKKYAKAKGSYKEYQAMFTKDKKKIARIITDGAEDATCQISADEIFQYYKDIIEKENKKNPKFIPIDRIPDEWEIGRLCKEITLLEITKAFDESDLKKAVGPDKIGLNDLNNVHNKQPRLLPRILSSWLSMRRVPESIKKNRSILIPKNVPISELKKISNWRPITIGTAFMKLFTKILTKRLTSFVELNTRQKGFMKVRGCLENLTLLQNIIKGARKNRNSLAVVFIDISKAFDSVSHGHILQSLERHRVPSYIRDIIKDLYTDSTTFFKGKNNEATPEITMKSGVKQGDSLSPLLFNIAMDPLICDLQKSGKGFTFGSDGLIEQITALAFADDIAVLSNTWEGMSTNLRIIEKFSKTTGLKLNVKKTHGFYISHHKDKILVNNCKPWQFEKQNIENINPGESERYLGLNFDPHTGHTSNNKINEVLVDWAQKLDNLPLKPTQKIEILCQYLVPKLSFKLEMAGTEAKTLNILDQTIKKYVKHFLHLPAYTCDGLLYSKRSFGGLSIPKLCTTIGLNKVNNLLYLRDAPDLYIAHSFMYAGEIINEKIDSIIKTHKLNILGSRFLRYDLNLLATYDWRKEEFEKWANLPVQGDGIKYLASNPTSNFWISKHNKMKENQYIAALMLRANVLYTRETITRGRNRTFATCRYCKDVCETISHISGACPKTKDIRIKRHNKVLELLIDRAKRCGWMTYREPHVKNSQGELRKPDVVFTKNGTAVVIDVSIRYENSQNSLELAFESKVKYYQDLSQQIKDLTNCNTVKFHGFIVGCRGIWPQCNDVALADLGLQMSFPFKKNVCLTTLMDTLKMCQVFMDN